MKESLFDFSIPNVWDWGPGTYYAAVIENHGDFHGKVVVDVGAGSGILSLFAAQASKRFLLSADSFDPGSRVVRSEGPGFLSIIFNNFIQRSLYK